MTRSPRRLKQQVRDTVGEQVRDLPLHAVRLAMFGVGRALLLSDRVTRDYKEITEGGGVKPVLGRLACDVQNTAEKVVSHVADLVRGEEPGPEAAPRPRGSGTETAGTPDPAGPEGGTEISVGKPGPRPSAEPAAKPRPVPEPETATEAASGEAEPGAAQAESSEGRPTEAEPEAEDEFAPKPQNRPAAPAEAERVADDLPVPNYDAATLPQLRARLRGLSADQVKLLREYERKHAARPDVIRMYERRIAKLNGHG
ncbi:hypothetical protein [Actinomadura roseirufa]|uniref:hypothetical protein n=1 Tax=Actinomadura roseirufa TaxID=2094049 RepID=UPI001041AE4F|nr:hypothetical protein [Actinomadura roseirufa]